tara:strand:- start:142751 stop:143485 length:735 start_codon:yes stop_codon:yes gene_type:complete
MIRRCALALVLACLAPMAQAQCRQALALGLDVSGSVDAREYRLQLSGLATALEDPRVQDALLAQPGNPVQLMVYEWSGVDDLAVLLPWRAITDATTLRDAVTTLRQTERRVTSPGTALGHAMMAGAAFLAQRPECRKHTLDISGDGKSNLGPRPRDISPTLGAGITINGLVIGIDDPAIGDIRQTEIGELSAYYRAEVILGPEAFVQTALGFSDYARAMTEKLLRELDGLVLSQQGATRPPVYQ